jgi:tetratricopeptide (TPR) repeat protein
MDIIGKRKIEIFCCYAREDLKLLRTFIKHLKPLEHQGLIIVWSDIDISAGAEWEKEIKMHLDSAQIILLFISPDFMASDYCYSIEMQRALERHKKDEAHVIPIILRSVYWNKGPLGLLQALPTHGKPVTDPTWHNIDRAFYVIVEEIHKVVDELAGRSQIDLLLPGHLQVLSEDELEDNTKDNTNINMIVTSIEGEVLKAKSLDVENLSVLSSTPSISPDSFLLSQRMLSLSNAKRDSQKVIQAPKQLRLQDNNASIMLQDALIAQVQGKLVEAICILQEIRTHHPDFRRWKIEELLTEILWKHAEQSACSGEWKEEIAALGILKEITYSERERVEELLDIALQNQSYAGVYDNAQLLFQEGNIVAAKDYLEIVWANAPYYGDPANLVVLVEVQAPDRKVKEQQKEHDYFIFASLPRGLGISTQDIWWYTFAFLIGLGSVIGILTQSWYWAGGISTLLVSFLYILRPYRAQATIQKIGVFLISIIVICSLAWYMATLNYNQSEISHLWIVGDRTFRLSKQVYFGLISSVLLSSLIFGVARAVDELPLDIENDIWPHVFIAFCAFVLFMIVCFIFTLFGFGFGFGFGWLFALYGWLVGCIGGWGFIQSIEIWRNYILYLTSHDKRTWYR